MAGDFVVIRQTGHRGGNRFRVRKILTKGTKETRGGELQQRIRNAVLEPPPQRSRSENQGIREQLKVRERMR